MGSSVGVPAGLVQGYCRYDIAALPAAEAPGVHAVPVAPPRLTRRSTAPLDEAPGAVSTQLAAPALNVTAAVVNGVAHDASPLNVMPTCERLSAVQLSWSLGAKTDPFQYSARTRTGSETLLAPELPMMLMRPKRAPVTPPREARSLTVLLSASRFSAPEARATPSRSLGAMPILRALYGPSGDAPRVIAIGSWMPVDAPVFVTPPVHVMPATVAISDVSIRDVSGVGAPPSMAPKLYEVGSVNVRRARLLAYSEVVAFDAFWAVSARPATMGSSMYVNVDAEQAPRSLRGVMDAADKAKWSGTKRPTSCAAEAGMM